MTATNTLKDALVSHVYRGQTFPTPTTHIGLLNTSGVELSGSGYARAPVGSAFPTPSSGVSTNGTAITFPAPASADWAPARFLAFYDASTGGNLLQTALFATDLLVYNGKTLRFPANQITVAFGGIPDGCWENGNLVPEDEPRIDVTPDIELVWLPAAYPALDVSPGLRISLHEDF